MAAASSVGGRHCCVCVSRSASRVTRAAAPAASLLPPAPTAARILAHCCVLSSLLNSPTGGQSAPSGCRCAAMASASRASEAGSGSGAPPAAVTRRARGRWAPASSENSTVWPSQSAARGARAPPAACLQRSPSLPSLPSAVMRSTYETKTSKLALPAPSTRRKPKPRRQQYISTRPLTRAAAPACAGSLSAAALSSQEREDPDACARRAARRREDDSWRDVSACERVLVGHRGRCRAGGHASAIACASETPVAVVTSTPHVIHPSTKLIKNLAPDNSQQLTPSASSDTFKACVNEQGQSLTKAYMKSW